MYKVIKITVIMTFLIFSLSAALHAANDKSIKGQIRLDIKNSMNNFIQARLINSQYHMFDPVTGKMLYLTLKELHEGIVKKGSYYVSCADFIDTKGRLIDLDFLVIQDGTQLATIQGIVHAVDGKKRKYHLE